MKVNRIDILINCCENKHKPYLCNEILNIMKGFGGEFKRDTIKLSAMPEHLEKELINKNIKFIRIG